LPGILDEKGGRDPLLGCEVTLTRSASAHKAHDAPAAATFKFRADEITVTQDQSAPTHRAEIVERDTEIKRHDVESVQSNTSSVAGDVKDAAGVAPLPTVLRVGEPSMPENHSADREESGGDPDRHRRLQ
jgi:hypothetical protein